MAALMAELLSLLLLLAAMAVISPAPTEAIKLEEFRTCGDTGFCRRQRTVPRTRTVLRMDDAPTALVYVPGRVPSLLLSGGLASVLYWNAVLLWAGLPSASFRPCAAALESCGLSAAHGSPEANTR